MANKTETIPAKEYRKMIATKHKKSKYNNVKCVVDGINFDSKAEAKRYGELLLLVKAKEIYSVKLQDRFDLIVNEERICFYKADFTYKICGTDELVVEDIKGMKETKDFIIKKKLMHALYGIEIKIIR